MQNLFPPVPIGQCQSRVQPQCQTQASVRVLCFELCQAEDRIGRPRAAQFSRIDNKTRFWGDRYLQHRQALFCARRRHWPVRRLARWQPQYLGPAESIANRGDGVQVPQVHWIKGATVNDQRSVGRFRQRGDAGPAQERMLPSP